MRKALRDLLLYFLFENLFLISSCHAVGAVRILAPYDGATFLVTNGQISVIGRLL